MHYKLLLLFLTLSLPACATVEQPPLKAAHITAAAPIPPENISHVVQKGQTLWRICKIYNVDLEELVRANRLPESAAITVGQNLIIPGSKSTLALAKSNFMPKDNHDFIWPAKGKIVSEFKQKLNGVSNKGIDIAIDADQDVLASQDGRVVFVGNLAGYGKTIIIEHKDGISTVYCGNASSSVKTGDSVKQGISIAKAGRTPRQDGSNLHFEIRRKNKPQNPLYYLN